MQQLMTQEKLSDVMAIFTILAFKMYYINTCQPIFHYAELFDDLLYGISSKTLMWYQSDRRWHSFSRVTFLLRSVIIVLYPLPVLELYQTRAVDGLCMPTYETMSVANIWRAVG